MKNGWLILIFFQITGIQAQPYYKFNGYIRLSRLYDAAPLFTAVCSALSWCELWAVSAVREISAHTHAHTREVHTAHSTQFKVTRWDFVIISSNMSCTITLNSQHIDLLHHDCWLWRKTDTDAWEHQTIQHNIYCWKSIPKLWVIWSSVWNWSK